MLIVITRAIIKKKTSKNMVKEMKELKWCAKKKVYLKQKKAVIQEKRNKKDVRHTENK